LPAPFLGRVEEVGALAADDRVLEVLPAEGVERADRVRAVGELVERVQLAGALDVVRRVDHHLAGQRVAERREHVLRCHSRNRERDDLRFDDGLLDFSGVGGAGRADAVDDLVAGGGPLGTERAADVPCADDGDPHDLRSIAVKALQH
jgi:hypothetical protein